MNTILKVIIILVLMALVLWAASLLIPMIHGPAILGTIIYVLLIILFAAWIAKVAGLWRD